MFSSLPLLRAARVATCSNIVFGNTLRVFQTPFYAGAHRAYLELGGAEVEQIVDECLGIWGRKNITIEE